MTVLRRIRLAALLVLLLLGLPGYILAGRSYSSDHAFTVENGQTIKASPTEGDRISMSVTMHHSINGLWAAPSGIYLSLTGQPPITLVGARYGDWGRSISSTSKASDENFTVGGPVTVPAAQGGRRTILKGSISGAVTYPKGGFLFSNEQESISVPVELTILPAAESAPLGAANLLRVLVVIAELLAAVLVITTVIGCGYSWAARVRAARRSRARGVRFRLAAVKDIVGLLLGALFAGGVAGLICLGVLTISGLLGASGAPDLIRRSPLTIAGLVGLAAALGVVSLMVSPDEPKQPAATA